MRIGIIATKLKGTLGVSVEVEKWSKVLTRLGHELFYCAGELDGFAKLGELIPSLHGADQSIRSLSHQAFMEGTRADGEQLCDQIYAKADEIRAPLRHFIRSNHLELIIVQNALTIPMNLPLGVCLTGLIAELGIPTIAHHHDFFWENERFRSSQAVLELLDTAFPADLPTLQHVTTNSIAKTRLKVRRRIDSTVIPNVFDFASPIPGIDGYNQDFRADLGLGDNDLFILQPTQILPRKGIEIAVDLVSRLNPGKGKLFITHRPEDEGIAYWHWLKREAGLFGVEVVLIDHLIGTERAKINHHKIYSFRDAYLYADLVTYPSLYEGFGNALLETIYFKRPAVVNRYPVYSADIRPLGFDFIELDGFINENKAEQIRQLLKDPDRIHEMAEKNYRIAQEHFSFEVLEKQLAALIASFS